MKTITLNIEGKLGSLVAPREAAAWSLILDEKKGKAIVLFRMKSVDDHSMATSLREAKADFPVQKWQATGTNPGAETSGGVELESPLYYYITLERSVKTLDWAVRYESGMQPWIASQRDLNASAANLPKELGANKDRIGELIAAFSELGQEVKGT